MALIESGTLGRFPSANTCRAHPVLSIRYGCESISRLSADGEEYPALPPINIGSIKYELYRHPEVLRSNTIDAWIKRYNWNNRHPQMLDYDEVHPCYVEAVEMYEAYKGLLTK